MRAYVKCPGCGDLGDIEHIAACRVMVRRAERELGARRGAMIIVECINRQLERRGRIDVDRLMAVIEHIGGMIE